MKKFLAISLSVLYLAISSGVVVNIHYCMGEIAEIALGQKNNDTCGQCGMDNDGCCHDDVKVVKIQDAHSITSMHADFVKAESLAQAPPVFTHATDMITLSTVVAFAHAPPGKGQVPLTIKNCVFRI